MLYHCQYTWNPGVTLEEVAARLLALHDAGTLHPEWIRGYYGLVGGGSGVLIVEVEDPNALTEMLVPTMALISWDVRAIVAYDYDADIAAFRQLLGQHNGG